MSSAQYVASIRQSWLFPVTQNSGVLDLGENISENIYFGGWAAGRRDHANLIFHIRILYHV